MALESSCGVLVALEAMKNPVAWGDVPTWLGGGASVATLAAAVWAGVLAKRALSLEFARDRDRDGEARRDQASKVSAWIGVKSSQMTSSDRMIWAGSTRGVFVSNSSPEPIYQVELILWKEASLRGSQLIPGLTPPGEHFKPIPYEAYTTMTTDQRGNELPVDDLDATFMLEIRFTDARGRRWRRAIDGQLHLELDPV